MKKQCPKRPGEGPAEILDIAERHLRRVLAALDAAIDDVETRGAAASAQARSAASDLRKAIQTVFEERQRIEKLDPGKQDAGDGFDLDAARAEIGRRLARLRERGGTERLSGEPQ